MWTDLGASCQTIWSKRLKWPSLRFKKSQILLTVFSSSLQVNLHWFGNAAEVADMFINFNCSKCSWIWHVHLSDLFYTVFKILKYCKWKYSLAELNDFLNSRDSLIERTQRIQRNSLSLAASFKNIFRISLYIPVWSWWWLRHLRFETSTCLIKNHNKVTARLLWYYTVTLKMNTWYSQDPSAIAP